LKAYFNNVGYIVIVSFIGRGNQKNMNKTTMINLII